MFVCVWAFVSLCLCVCASGTEQSACGSEGRLPVPMHEHRLGSMGTWRVVLSSSAQANRATICALFGSRTSVAISSSTHCQPTRDMHDALWQAFGARIRQSSTSERDLMPQSLELGRLLYVFGSEQRSCVFCRCRSTGMPRPPFLMLAVVGVSRGLIQSIACRAATQVGSPAVSRGVGGLQGFAS